MKVVSIAGKRLVLSVLIGGIGLWLLTIGYGLFFTQAYYSQQEDSATQGNQLYFVPEKTRKQLRNGTPLLNDELDNEGSLSNKGKPKEHTSDSVFEARKRRIQDVCWNHTKIPGGANEVFFNEQAGMIYCVVPKAGCTFWKRIFRAFEKHPKATMDDVLNFTRAEVHDEFNGGHGQPFSLRYYNMTQYPTRILVARDPYSRLLSVYLDKIYLPDFWNFESKELLKALRKERKFKFIHEHGYSSQSSVWEELDLSPDTDDFLRQQFEWISQMPEFNHLAKSKKPPPPTQHEKLCGKYLTFSQFVNATFLKDEPHWTPIHAQCNPCQFRATHLSTMETFNEDARPLLAKLDLEDVVDYYSGNDQVDSELSMIVNYNFERVYHERDSEVLKPCLNYRELAFRLWNNFRWRGYIDPDIEYAIPEFTDEKQIREDLMTQLWRARASGLLDPDKMERAKREFKQRAFATLDKEQFDRITEKYSYDIELFGYEDIRDELVAIYK